MVTLMEGRSTINRVKHNRNEVEKCENDYDGRISLYLQMLHLFIFN